MADEGQRYDTSPLGEGENWVTKAGGLPLFVRAIAHALMKERGMSEQQAISVAISKVKKAAGGDWSPAWGHPGHAHPPTQAKGASSASQWAAMKASTHGKSRSLPQDNEAYHEGIADQRAGRPAQTKAEFNARHPGEDADDYPLYQAGYNSDADDLGVEFKASGSRDGPAVVTEGSSAGNLLPTVGKPLAPVKSKGGKAVMGRHRFVGKDSAHCVVCGLPRSNQVHQPPFSGSQKAAQPIMTKSRQLRALPPKTAPTPDHNDSGMVSLDLPNRLARTPGGEDPAKHHITVAFLGKNLSEDDWDTACARAKSIAANAEPPTGIIAGTGTFPPTEFSDGKVPFYAKPYVSGIGEIHRKFQDLDQSSFSAYQPHITLAYLEPGAPQPVGPAAQRVTFTHLSVHGMGDRVERFPFLGQGHRAAPKLLSKASVNYRPTDSKTVHCTSCVHVEEHGEAASTCDLVEGTVDREHVCDRFETGDEGKRHGGALGHRPVISGHIKGNAQRHAKAHSKAMLDEADRLEPVMEETAKDLFDQQRKSVLSTLRRKSSRKNGGRLNAADVANVFDLDHWDRVASDRFAGALAEPVDSARRLVRAQVGLPEDEGARGNVVIAGRKIGEPAGAPRVVVRASGVERTVPTPTASFLGGQMPTPENVANQLKTPSLVAPISTTASAPELVRARANRLAGLVNDETYDQIKEQLAQGVAAGESQPKLAARVRSVFDQADQVRATRIARTETIGALNHSAWDYAMAQPRSVVAGKVWIGKNDGRERWQHVLTNNQAQPIDHPFAVAGYPAQFPGDPSLPPDSVINCRCTMLVLPPKLAAERGITYPDSVPATVDA